MRRWLWYASGVQVVAVVVVLRLLLRRLQRVAVEAVEDVSLKGYSEHPTLLMMFRSLSVQAVRWERAQRQVARVVMAALAATRPSARC